MKQKQLILLLSLLPCLALAYLDGVAHPAFVLKSAIKVLLFIGVPVLYAVKTKSAFYKPLLTFDRSALRFALVLGGCVFSLILGCYFALGSLLDLSAVVGQLETSMAVTADNFIAVALYIAIINSFCEEFFFRGFVFFQLKQTHTRMVAHCLSALFFALYHVAIIAFWFDLWVFALCMIALFIGGVLFNLLNENSGTIYPSWLTHACANLAINSIGMILFYAS